MKKILKHSIILIGLIILFNQLGIHSGDLYKDGASIVCEQKRIAVRKNKWDIPENKPTVLYFGASGVLSALIPSVFDSLMNHQTYSLNLALPALPIGPYHHTLLEYLKNNPPPDYIIMTYVVSKQAELLFDRYANQGINFPKEAISYFIHHKSKNQTLNYLLPSHTYSKPMFKYIYNSVFNPERIKRRKKETQEIIDKMIDNRGYYSIIEQSRFPNGELPPDYKEESDCSDCEMPVYDPASDVFVEKFFNLTEKHNIRVLLITHPIREGKFKQFEETPHAIQYLTSKYEHVSYPSEGWKLDFYPNRYFADPHHLNKKGAYRFTEEVAKNFKNTHLPDHELISEEKPVSNPNAR